MSMSIIIKNTRGHSNCMGGVYSKIQRGFTLVLGGFPAINSNVYSGQ